MIQGAIGVEVVHQPHPDGGRLPHPGPLGGIIEIGASLVHVADGPVPLGEEGVARPVVDGRQPPVDQAEQGGLGGRDGKAEFGRRQIGRGLAPLAKVVEAFAVEVVGGVGIPQQDVVAAEEDRIERLHVGGIGHQGESGVVAAKARPVYLIPDGGYPLSRCEQCPPITSGHGEDEGAAEIGVAQADRPGVTVRQGEIAEAGEVYLPPCQGTEQVRLVGEGAQGNGFVQHPGQQVDVVGTEPLDALASDHGEGAVVLLQDADPQLGLLAQPSELRLRPAGRQRGGIVAAVQGQGLHRLKAEQTEQDQCSI